MKTSKTRIAVRSLVFEGCPFSIPKPTKVANVLYDANKLDAYIERERLKRTLGIHTADPSRQELCYLEHRNHPAFQSRLSSRASTGLCCR
jgi:hypothetical protein